VAPLSAICSIWGGFLRRLVRAADAALRRIGGVSEFETADDGLLRIAEGHAEHDFDFRGTHVRHGQSVIDLHLWNEHLPPFPYGGARIGMEEARSAAAYGKLAQASIPNRR